MQMLPDTFRRRIGQILVKRNIGVIIAFKQLRKMQRPFTGIFNVVPHRKKNIASISGAVVKTPCLT